MASDPTDTAARLTVMQAHLAADCPDRATCWAKDIHDAHNPEGAPMDLSPTLELPLLDDRCTHPRCSEAEKGDAYRMVASCMNCSTRAVLLLTSGHDFPSYSSGPKCPACGVRRWSKVGLEDG